MSERKKNGPKCASYKKHRQINLALKLYGESLKSKREKYFQQKCVKEFVFCVPNHQILRV